MIETQPEPVRTVVACCASGRPKQSSAIDTHVEYYCALLDAAAESSPDLVCLPECVTSWGLAHGEDGRHARPVPGPESDAFAAKAKEHGFVLALSMLEQIGECEYNTGVVFARDGRIVGKYHKVHLAVNEGRRGTSPGREWPVFDTDCGRLGMAICKDSSIPESARCLAARGMQVLLMPIMGDHRAVQWSREPQPSTFDHDRWQVIQRCRAMDNHIWMVVCRNAGEGSCIIAPNGDILAYNRGDTNIITAEIEPGADWRCWRGSTFRDSVWAERRPGLYGELYA